MNFTTDDIEIGKTYRVKSSAGNILTRKVLAIDSPHKGMLWVERIEENAITKVHTSAFVKVMKLHGIGGTGE